MLRKIKTNPSKLSTPLHSYWINLEVNRRADKLSEVRCIWLPQGTISGSVIQGFTVSSHLTLHSHLFSLWGEGTFPFFPLTHTETWRRASFRELHIPFCTQICGKVQRQQSLANSLTSLWSLTEDCVVLENYDLI